eukprot:8905981-Pyramimonas_sp.AAC.2
MQKAKGGERRHLRGGATQKHKITGVIHQWAQKEAVRDRGADCAAGQQRRSLRAQRLTRPNRHDTPWENQANKRRGQTALALAMLLTRTAGTTTRQM